MGPLRQHFTFQWKWWQQGHRNKHTTEVCHQPLTDAHPSFLLPLSIRYKVDIAVMFFPSTLLHSMGCVLWCRTMSVRSVSDRDQTERTVWCLQSWPRRTVFQVLMPQSREKWFWVPHLPFVIVSGKDEESQARWLWNCMYWIIIIHVFQEASSG